MNTFIKTFNSKKVQSIFNTLNSEIQKVSNPGPGVGSYLVWETWNYRKEFLSKQEILFEESKSAEIIIEIGIHYGHSLLIMLLANPTSKIYAIDINNYSIHAINYLNKIFNNRIKYYNGDSLQILSNVLHDINNENIKINLAHIDGMHSYEYVYNEIVQIIPHCSQKFKIICDDYSTNLDSNADGIKNAIADVIKKYNLYIERISNNDDSVNKQISYWNNCVITNK